MSGSGGGMHPQAGQAPIGSPGPYITVSPHGNRTRRSPPLSIMIITGTAREA
jgi:hypothetical protein